MQRWRVAILLLFTTIIGGMIGYFSLPRNISNIAGPGYSLSVVGLQIAAVLGGAGISLLLLICVGSIWPRRTSHKSYRLLFWQSVGIFAVAFVGAFLGSTFLPSIFPISIRIFWGAIFALEVLLCLRQNPKDALRELDIAGCLEGCLSFHLLLAISFIGIISSFFIWYK